MRPLAHHVRSNVSGVSAGRFVDLFNNTFGAAAKRLRALHLHILVDLNGYTTHERAELLATQPAPVAMHAVGFPGTMGAKFVPYMLVDRVMVAAKRECRARLSGCLRERRSTLLAYVASMPARTASCVCLRQHAVPVPVPMIPSSRMQTL